MPIRKIAVLGAGHGGCAAAADLTLRGFEVRLHARREETLAPLRAAGGIGARGVVAGRARPALMTTSLAEATEGADLAMLVVPSVAHADYAAALAPLMRPDLPVFVNPGHTGGGLHFAAALRRAGYDRALRCCETVTLTYICRKGGPAEIDIFAMVKKLGFAALPGRITAEMAALIRPLYPEIRPCSSVLETGLMNLNAVFHPPGMVMNAGWIEATGGAFRFYAEGMTPAVGRVVASVDAERIAVARALGVPTQSFLETFFAAGLTTRAAMESGDIARACAESAANAAIMSPPSLDHRYMHEDIGYGLVPIAAFGDLAGVATPTIDALIRIGSDAAGIDYAAAGLGLDAMGLAGMDAARLLAFVEEGA